MATNDPLVRFCRLRGYRIEPQRNVDGSEDPRTIIVEFPCKFPEGTLLAEDMTAFEQLDLQRRLQTEWADNAVSVTVYFSPDELEDVKGYLREHWRTMKSVSFMLRQDHGFDQAPLEEFTEGDYDEMLSRITGGVQMTLTGAPAEFEDDECASGACPVR